MCSSSSLRTNKIMTLLFYKNLHHNYCITYSVTFDCNRGNSSGYDYFNKQSIQITLVKHCNDHLTYLIKARYNSQIFLHLYLFTFLDKPASSTWDVLGIGKEILVMWSDSLFQIKGTSLEKPAKYGGWTKILQLQEYHIDKIYKGMNDEK